MGGASSKKRSKSSKNVAPKLPQSSVGFNGGNGRSVQDRTVLQSPTLERPPSPETSHNALPRTPSHDANSWLFLLEESERLAFSSSQTSAPDDSLETGFQFPDAPPPYSEVCPLGHARGSGSSGIETRARCASIPNLMDLDVHALDAAFQSGVRYGTASRDPSSSWQKATDVSEFQTWSNTEWQDKIGPGGASRDDLTSSNPNLVPEFEHKFKSKENGKGPEKSKRQKPAALTKKRDFRSNPDLLASTLQIAPSGRGPRNRNRFPQGRQKSHGNAGGDANQYRNKVINPEQLTVLARKSDQEVLFRVQNYSTGFMSLLEETEYSDEVLVLVMDILARVCRNDDCPHTANGLLQTALYTKLFNVRMVRYLQTAPYDGSMDENPTLLQNLLVVFTVVLREFKKEAEQKLGNCLTLGRQAIAQLIGPSGDLDDELIQQLRNLTDVQKLNKGKAFEQFQEFPAVFNVNCQQSPLAEPKTAAEYRQRLLQVLQEEFVDSLRLGPEDTGSPRPEVYRNVVAIGSDCTRHEGFVQKLSFDPDDPDLPWDESTRLLEGSTVFLSPDLEKELHCAVVVRRRPEDLLLGHVWVKLLDRKSTVLRCPRPLDMVENFTYKDDFISLMEALHLQMVHPLPFASHILGMKKKVSHPTYLDAKSLYSFPSLPVQGKDAKKQFNALNVNTWPSAQALGHDSPFHEAFKHALTKDLALVRFSSGAEAIKFGVSVVQTLLHNKALWRSSHQAPVTVLFRTDEALDDFLKALLAKFPQEKVLRMGANHPDTLLSSYDLDESRRIVSCTEDFPSYVMQNRRVLQSKMGKLKTEIADKMDLLDKAKARLLKGETLKGQIASHHWNQLQSEKARPKEDPILAWLSSYSASELQCLKNQQQDMSGKMPKAGKPKPGKKSRFPERSDNCCGSALIQMEMNRRVASSPASEEFDAMGRSFNPTSASNVDNSFIPQDQIRKDPLGQLQGKQFFLADVMKLELDRKDVMVASEVDDVLLLGARDRWRLYRFWIAEFQRGVSKELSKLQEKYEKSFLQMQEVIREIDVSILRRAVVVGATTASAASHHKLFKMVAPRILLVEEAGQISEPSLIACLTEQCCHLIMIGDHHQLRPAINGFRSSDRASRPRTNSLFETLIIKGINHVSLSDSHHMSSSLQHVLKCLFADLPFSPNDAMAPPTSTVSGMASDIFFVNNSWPESMTSASPCCYTNEYEANYLVQLARYLVSQKYDQSQITVLATSIRQVQLLMKLFKQNNLCQVACASVEDYQGKSNDLVLLSLVRSNGHGDVGIMADDKYMSVALTRARLGLYCIGNLKMLVDALDCWKARITFLAGQQLYGSTLTLMCGWHPAQACVVNSWEALKAAVSGICKLPCHAIMTCGHMCMKECHAEDRDHKSARCTRPCEKVVCPAGHKCPKKCFEKCPPCKKSILMVQSCGHKAMVTCANVRKKPRCTEKCKKMLSCGHACPKPCGEECDDISCTAINEYHDSPCGHTFFVSCHEKLGSGLERLCPMPCNEALPCGHSCTGSCGKCHQGRMHFPCKEKCTVVLICGHECQEPCGSSCGPCKDTCGSRCEHARCQSACGRPCIPCLKPCGWRCVHQKCSKMCFERCDRTACNVSCPFLLPCRHPCIGFCGEPCPALCRICDRARILEGMPGSRQIGTARFVLLEDCNHVVEVTSMNKLMQDCGTVEVKTCPKCGAAIRRCLRYSNVIKSTLFDVSKIVHQCTEGDSGTSVSVRDIRNAIKALPEAMLPEAVRQLKTEVQRTLSCQEAAVLENKRSFLQCMLTLWQANMLVSSPDRRQGHQVLLTLKEAYLGLSSASGQVTLDAFVSQLKRAMYLVHLFQFLKKHPAISSSDKTLYDHLRNYLSDTKTFNAAAEAMVVRQIERLYFTCNIPNAHVKGIANVPVFDVEQLTAGHWTKCSNGRFCFSKLYVEGQEVQCKLKQSSRLALAL